MIKLTLNHGEPIYINPNKIDYLRRSIPDESTTVQLGNPNVNYFLAEETPEQIIALILEWERKKRHGS